MSGLDSDKLKWTANGRNMKWNREAAEKIEDEMAAVADAINDIESKTLPEINEHTSIYDVVGLTYDKKPTWTPHYPLYEPWVTGVTIGNCKKLIGFETDSGYMLPQWTETGYHLDTNMFLENADIAAAFSALVTACYADDKKHFVSGTVSAFTADMSSDERFIFNTELPVLIASGCDVLLNGFTMPVYQRNFGSSYCLCYHVMRYHISTPISLDVQFDFFIEYYKEDGELDYVITMQKLNEVTVS